MKRTLIQAVIFSIVLILVYFGVQIARGVYNTVNYTPDIINSYQSVDYLQNEVSFGIVWSPYGLVLELLGLIIFGMIVFISAKFVLKKIKNRKN